MEAMLQDKVLARELEILSDEAIRNHTRVERDENQARRTMALVQVDVCQGLMNYLVQNRNWSNFEDVLLGALEDEYSRYLDAWAVNDRATSRIAIARVRIIRTLIRRLADPQRRQLIAFEFERRVVEN